MNVLQHIRNELNLCLKENRPDRSYRDTLLIVSIAKWENHSLGLVINVKAVSGQRSEMMYQFKAKSQLKLNNQQLRKWFCNLGLASSVHPR